jgi:hypothetical protein
MRGRRVAAAPASSGRQLGRDLHQAARLVADGGLVFRAHRAVCVTLAPYGLPPLAKIAGSV